MKSPLEAVHFITSTLSRLDPLYPRTTIPDGADLPAHDEASGHAAAGHHAIAGHHAMGMGPAQYAFVLAVLSGLSLPLGAVLGVALKPVDTTIARWIAIGAGALLFAVSVELYGHSIHSFSAGHTELVPMIILLATSLLGSYLFTYISTLFEEEDEEHEEQDEEHAAGSLSKPGRISIDSDAASVTNPGCPPTPMAHQAHHHPPHANTHGTVPAQSTGRGIGAMLRKTEEHNRKMAQKRWNHMREMMKKYHIINFLQKQAEARKLTDGTAQRRKSLHVQKAKDMFQSLKKAWEDTKDSGPDPEEQSDFAKSSRKAAMSMLIMLIVDGIPEGILMGFMSASGTLGFTFVLSLVIANFPEGFAGGVLMDSAKIPYIQIILAWSLPMMLTAVGAGIACYMLLWLVPTYSGGHHQPYSIQVLVALTEGIAGGAMISGIAATMLPEAFERRDKKGGILGSGGFLCTFGFLLSFGIKIMLD